MEIIDYIFNKWFKNTVYIRFKSDWMSARLVEKNRIYEDKPILALIKDNKKYKILSVGTDAELEYAKDKTDLTLCNGFQHPRSCIKDFEVAEATIRHFLCKLFIAHRVLFRPIIVLHPLEKAEGGLTQVEARALKELGESAGALEAYIWVGRELTDDELVNLEFPEKEGTLGYSRD